MNKDDILNSLKTMASIKKIGPLKIDEENSRFQINGSVVNVGKKPGALSKMMAVGTLGMSVIAEKAISGNKQHVGQNKWFQFSDLLSYEFLEDDAVVVSGGVGQALIGGAVFGAAGAIAGGITGKRVQKKRVDSLQIKITLNSFDYPCVLVPIISKPTKTNSKEYHEAMKEAHQILAALDVISHKQ